MTVPFAIGVDSYSYHRFFGETRRGERPADAAWTVADLLHRAEDASVEVLSLETCHLPSTAVDALRAITSACADHGTRLVLAWGHPDGVAMGSRTRAWQDLTALVEAAAASGIDLVRMVLGGPRQFLAEPEHVVRERVTAPLRAAVDHAARHDVRLAVETHCDLTIATLAQIVEDVPGLGVVLDTGNVIRIGEHTTRALELVGDRVLMVHAKDLALDEIAPGTPPDGLWWTTPVGDGGLDIDSTIDHLVQRGFRGPVCVELMELASDWRGREDDAVQRSLDNLHRLRRFVSERMSAAN